jgi:hypothetical protein
MCLIIICDTLYVITSVMTPCNDPGFDWPSLLKGGMSQPPIFSFQSNEVSVLDQLLHLIMYPVYSIELLNAW